MKDQSKVTTKARSEQMRKKQSNVQKKEEFCERIAAYLNSQDEAKRSVVPEGAKLRCVPGAYVLQFDIDTIEEENRNYMLLKQEEKKEETKDYVSRKELIFARMDEQIAQNRSLMMYAAKVPALDDVLLQRIDERKAHSERKAQFPLTPSDFRQLFPFFGPETNS